jgi:hypothetical protein
MGQLGKRRYFNSRPTSGKAKARWCLNGGASYRVLKPGIKSLNQNPDQFVDFCVDTINSMNYYDLRIVGHWHSASMTQKVRKIFHKLVEILDRYIIYATYQHHP